MRTTLSLDEDVAVALRRRQRQHEARWRDIVNEALREGIRALDDASDEPPTPARTEPVSLGRARLDVANVAEALAAAEGDHHA